jgi:hypothetical protein
MADLEQQIEFLLEQQAQFDVVLDDTLRATAANMRAVDRLIELVDYLFTREAGLGEWKQQSQEKLDYLLRAQEQTDKKLNALGEEQAQVKKLLTEIKLKLDKG